MLVGPGLGLLRIASLFPEWSWDAVWSRNGFRIVRYILSWSSCGLKMRFRRLFFFGVVWRGCVVRSDPGGVRWKMVLLWFWCYTSFASLLHE